MVPAFPAGRRRVDQKWRLMAWHIMPLGGPREKSDRPTELRVPLLRIVTSSLNITQSTTRPLLPRTRRLDKLLFTNIAASSLRIAGSSFFLCADEQSWRGTIRIAGLQRRFRPISAPSSSHWLWRCFCLYCCIPCFTGKQLHRLISLPSYWLDRAVEERRHSRH
jgi:hypothetical protein